MSLINRVLQDLEKRRGGPLDDAQIPEQVRSVAAPKVGKQRTMAVWLIVGGAVAVSLLVWFGGAQFRDSVQALWAGAADAPPAVATGPEPAKEEAESPLAVQARVEAALMVPVFQMSDELSSLPAGAARNKSMPEKPVKAAMAKPPAEQARKPRAVKSNETAAAVAPAPASGRPSAPESPPKTKPMQTPPASSNSTSARLATASPQPADTAAKAKPGAAEALEEVVIPADLAPQPIEKQARQLTAFERAENEFRQGVASLRRGRMVDAEARFRAAINEDRSHSGAQQALVGILIDAGRLEDAEDVLAASLSANPRQPNQAMLLARLQVERGDLERAIRTLQSVGPYTGTDARYLSFMAAVLQRADRHQEAVVQYRSALAMMPRNAVWLMGLGISLRAIGEKEQAQQAFASAAAIGTLNSDLQAFVEQQQRQLARAVN